MKSSMDHHPRQSHQQRERPGIPDRQLNTPSGTILVGQCRRRGETEVHRTTSAFSLMLRAHKLATGFIGLNWSYTPEDQQRNASPSPGASRRQRLLVH